MHNFKKLIRALCVAAAAAALFLALDYALYPCTFTRNDIHAVLTNRYDDLYLGTSHGKMDIDPETMEAVSGRSGHNLCVGGEYSQDSYYLVKLVLEKGYKPSRIVYEVSPGYFTSEKEEGNNYLLFYHEFPLSTAKLDYFWNTVKDCNFRTMLFPWYEYPLSYELEHLGATICKSGPGISGRRSCARTRRSTMRAALSSGIRSIRRSLRWRSWRSFPRRPLFHRTWIISRS